VCQSYCTPHSGWFINADIENLKLFWLECVYNRCEWYAHKHLSPSPTDITEIVLCESKPRVDYRNAIDWVCRYLIAYNFVRENPITSTCEMPSIMGELLVPSSNMDNSNSNNSDITNEPKQKKAKTQIYKEQIYNDLSSVINPNREESKKDDLSKDLFADIMAFDVFGDDDEHYDDDDGYDDENGTVYI
jgi:hypothetical protein